MVVSRRDFLLKLSVGMAALPFGRDISWAQTKSKLGYMKIVDSAAMFISLADESLKIERLASRQRA